MQWVDVLLLKNCTISIVNQFLGQDFQQLSRRQVCQIFLLHTELFLENTNCIISWKNSTKNGFAIIWFVFNGHELRSFLSANAFGAWLQLADSSLALESFKTSEPVLELRSSCLPLLLEATDLLSEFVSSSDSSDSIPSSSLLSF